MQRLLGFALVGSVCWLGGCSKKEAAHEQGSAPPPIASSKPGACASGGGNVSDTVSAAYFPKVSGEYCLDPNGDARAYGEGARGTLDTVCTELLDGECEVYKSFGLKRVVTVRYVDGKGSPGSVNVTVSRFATSEGAYGFFTKRVVADGDPAEGTPRPLEAGATGALGTGIAYVFRGDFVAELSYANEIETPDQLKTASDLVLPVIARELGGKLPGTAEPLPAVRALPKEKLVPMGVSYNPHDLLGVSGFGPGAAGYYKDGEQRYRVLSLVRPDEDSAKDVIGTLKKLPAAKALKDIGFDAVAFATRETPGAPQAEWLAGRSGSRLIVVGDEPFALKAGPDLAKTRLAEDRKLALLKAALAGGS